MAIFVVRAGPGDLEGKAESVSWLDQLEPDGVIGLLSASGGGLLRSFTASKVQWLGQPDRVKLKSLNCDVRGYSCLAAGT